MSTFRHLLKQIDAIVENITKEDIYEAINLIEQYDKLKRRDIMEQNYMRVAQQGWQCPLCLRIYGPIVQECYHCNNKETTLTSTTFPDIPEGVTTPNKPYKNPYEVHFASVEVNNGK